jgi:glycosyltransferase involved in cell wall biosynthesis
LGIEAGSDAGITVSVLVASRNREDLLHGCLESLLAQTLQSMEILVIHGPGGNDWEATAPYRADPRIRGVPSPRPGLYAAWNAGIQVSQGQYLCNLNSDDRLREDALAVMAAALDAHPEVCLVYGDSLVTTRPGETFAHNSSRGRRLAQPNYQPRVLLAGCCCGPHPMWRRSVHAWAGGFDETYAITGDYAFWLRLAERAPMLHLEETLGLYLDHPQGLSRADPARAVAERVRAMKSVLHRYRDIIRVDGVPLEPLI